MRSAAKFSAIAATLLLGACGGADARVSGPSEAQARGPAGDYPMVLGAPFVVDGVTYTPADTMNYDSVGYAQIGDATGGISGAHRTLPLPSYVEVTSLESGRTILVRLTERGPMRGNALIALSPQAWAQLGLPAGTQAAVRVRRTNPPEAERAQLRSGGQVPPRMDTPAGLLSALKRKLGGPAPAAIAPHTPPVAALDKAATAAPQRPSAVAKTAAVKTATPVVSPVAKPPAAKPAVAPKPEPVAKASSAEASAAGLFVQAGAYSDKARAEAVAKAIGGSLSRAGAVWRVRTGPHKDRGQADAALAKVRAAGYADARVLTAP